MSGCLSKYDGYTRYMSADTAARREEFDRLITNSLKEIEEKNEILRGFKRLSGENRIYQVLIRCEKLKLELLWRDDDKHDDYLQQELNVTYNMRDENVRCRELGDVLFYYLLRDEEPAVDIQELIRGIDTGLILFTSWYETCAIIIGRFDVFTQFYKRLGNEPQHVEYLIYKHPQLLFNNYSPNLINKLNKHLPRDNLHQILLNTRDENGQACMFTFTYELYFEPELSDLFKDVYRNNFDDLCELLSVRNKDGKTALYVNIYMCEILLSITTLKNQYKVNKLLSIRDNNNQTVYDTANVWGKELTTWLKHQYEHDNYPLSNYPSVLILYNTNDRSEAKKEAVSIQQAFQSVIHDSEHLEMNQMGTKCEVLKLIAHKASAADSMLIVCLMSHGNIGTINDSENDPITLTSIEGAMCSDQLTDRPKILIIQSCQTRAGERKYTDKGTNTDPGTSTKTFVPNSPYVPSSANFLSVQSSVSGQKSERNVFMPYLAEQIKNSSKNDSFIDLVKKVILTMQRLKKDEQIPILSATLGGNVCLNDQWTNQQLTWLRRQHVLNNYPLYNSPRVLILYNTNERPGAEKEAESIQQAFLSVTHLTELKKIGTECEVLELIAREASVADFGLIVCLMSHGNIGTIDGSANNPIMLTSIEAAMCSDQLKEQPKILITQSCQTRAGGRKRTHAEEATCSNTDCPPAHALRNCSKSDDFEDLFMNASLKMKREENEQIPILKSTLRGKVCLKDQWVNQHLTWLKHQDEHNNYLLYNCPRVLILYNTNDRPGAEEEAESIQRAFKSMTFCIELEKMGTKRKVLELIAQQAANSDTSVLIVCLMSHGNIGTIDDSEGNPITLTSIEGAMCSDQLKERPKILITQSCQTRAGGRKYTDKGTNRDRPPASAFVPSIPYEPVADHFLSVQSCVSGQESTRNVFIPYLAEQIIKSSETDDFVDLVPNVSFKMLQKRIEQIPIVKSTLRRSVCLKDTKAKDI